MIEFAKMDASIVYGEMEKVMTKTIPPVSTTGLPPKRSPDITIGNTTTTAESKESEIAADSQVQANIKTTLREDN